MRFRKRPAGASPHAPLADAHPEDSLQAAIVAFHARACPQTEAVLFAVPNGEARSAVTAARLSGITSAQRAALTDADCLRPAGQGVLPGVSDLVLVLAQGRVVFVEVKIPLTTYPPTWVAVAAGVVREVIHKAGELMKVQKRFRAGVQLLGHDYRVIRTIEDYADLLEEKGCRLLCRPWGPGVLAPRPPAHFRTTAQATA